MPVSFEALVILIFLSASNTDKLHRTIDITPPYNYSVHYTEQKNNILHITIDYNTSNVYNKMEMFNKLNKNKRKETKMKRLIVDLDEELHKEMKIKALQDDKTVKQYVTDLIRKDTETKKE